MLLAYIGAVLLSLLCFLASASQAPLRSRTKQNATQHHQYLHLNAITSSPRPPHHAVLECWKMSTPFTPYPTIGASLALGNISNLTLVTLPPNSREPLHHPPHPMFFILLSGRAHITLPADPDGEGLWIEAGSIIFANDMTGVGHWTEYPGEQGAVALQAPFRDGVLPEHVVVGKGPCSSSEDQPRW